MISMCSRSLNNIITGTSTLVLAAALVGCGLGTQTPSVAPGALTSSLGGQLYGGPNPIIGATVKLYTTGNADGSNGGYGVATMRQEATAVNNGASYPSGDTSIKGNFSFAGGYSCPAGQFAYIVSSSGNTGASSSASGGTATATVGGVTAVTVNAGGTSYSATPTVTITPAAGDTTGSGATATATVTSGVITKITVTSPGSFYTAAPTVTITDATGSGAAATASTVVSGVTGATVTAAGTGYYAASVTITASDGNGSGATGSAVVNPSNGAITAIKIIDAGSGYDAAPNVTITNGANGVYNPANNAAVLVAALGRCEDLYTGGVYSGTPIYINELSTIAAAYALGHFSTVSGTGAATVVQIGAPASNNAAQIGGVSTGCVAGQSTCTTTATAGLAHAFLNAANLVNVFPTAGGNNSTVTSNTSVVPAYGTYITGYTGSVPVIPTALINSIGNTLVSCVNSSGGVANDGSACGTIFKLTTLPSAIAGFYTYSTGTAAPTNTFSAMVNLAANPSLGGSTTNVTSFYNIAGAFTSVYAPALTAAPTQDWSIAINYPEAVTTGVGTGVGSTPTGTNSVCATSPCQGLGYTPTAAVDINDILYVGNNSSASGVVPVNIVAFSSNGKLLGETLNSTTGGVKYTTGMSVDATGYGYFGQGSGSTSAGTGVFTTGGGSVGSLTGGGSVAAPTVKGVGVSFADYGTAVDLANNVWAAGTGASLYTFGAGAVGTTNITAVTTYTMPASLTPNSSLKNIGIQLDPNQNVWVTAGPNTAANLNVLENTGTVATPTYSNASTLSTTTGVGPTGGVTFAGSPYVAYVGGYSGNSTPGVQPYTPTFGAGANAAQVTAITAGTLSVAGSITGTDLLQSDGTGALYVTNFNNGSLATQFWSSGTATGYKLNPCVETAPSLTATSCSLVFGSSPLTKPEFFALDSSGSAWVGSGLPTSGPTAGALIQIIGTAAPTVPLISLGKQGQLP